MFFYSFFNLVKVKCFFFFKLLVYLVWFVVSDDIKLFKIVLYEI